MACESCRVRKAKCDGKLPTCTNCLKARRDCTYTPAKKRGPNKKSIKKLEERLALLEKEHGSHVSPDAGGQYQKLSNDSPSDDPQAAAVDQTPDGDAQNSRIPLPPGYDPLADLYLPTLDGAEWDFNMDESFLLEPAAPIPTPEMDKALQDLYFEHMHPHQPMLHQASFTQKESPLCLRYAIWALGALWSPEFSSYSKPFGRSAREQLEADELKGLGESYVTVAHAQAWIMMAWFEALHHSFVRAWMSSRRTVALCQILGLDRLDAPDAARSKILPPPQSWVELEERRRTFWCAFGSDRWSAGGHGWPMTINIDDIETNLPASEEYFQRGIVCPAGKLKDLIKDGFDNSTSFLAAQSALAYCIGLNSIHQHRRPRGLGADEADAALWAQHRFIDNLLSKLFLTLPDHLQTIKNIRDPRPKHLLTTMHVSVISLQIATLSRADKTKLDPSVIAASMQRAYSAAEEIVNTARLTCHIAGDPLPPFSMFGLFVAVHVFIMADESRFPLQRTRDNIEFALAVGHKVQNGFVLFQQLFGRLCAELQRSRYADLVTDRYRNSLKENNTLVSVEPPGGGLPSGLNAWIQPQLMADSDSPSLSGVGI